MGEAAYAELCRLCEDRLTGGNRPAPHPATVKADADAAAQPAAGAKASGTKAAGATRRAPSRTASRKR